MDQLNAAVFLGFLFGVLATLSLWLLVRLLKPRSRPGRLEIDPLLQLPRRTGARQLVLAYLLLSTQAACTPAQTAAVGKGFATAAKVVLDLAKCEMAGGGSPLMKTVAEELAASPEARERYRSALVAGQALKIGGVYIGAQDAACLLSMVASVIPQSGAPHGEGLGELIVRRAEVCDTDGGCEKPEDRAAQLLRDLWQRGVVVLPPSGQG